MESIPSPQSALWAAAYQGVVFVEQEHNIFLLIFMEELVT